MDSTENDELVEQPIHESPEERKARKSREIMESLRMIRASGVDNPDNYREEQIESKTFDVESAKEVAETTGLTSIKQSITEIKTLAKGAVSKLLDNIKKSGGSDGR